MQCITIFLKELLENARNFKWIWVPLVFILLSVMDPLTTYYMPVLLDNFGNLPEGSQINIPTPPPTEVFWMSFSQLNVLGILVVLLMSMGLISAERKSGVSEMVLVKPVSYTSYVTAKFASTLLLTLISAFIGLLASWYYVNLLFGEVPFSHYIGSVSFYSVWLMFIVSISIILNTAFRTPGLVGFLSVAALLLASAINSVFKSRIEWLPPQINAYIKGYLSTGSITDDLWITAFVTIGVTAILLIVSVFILRKKELAA